MAKAPVFGLFGVHRGRNAEPDALGRRARLAEEAGFESVWVGDHISLPMGAQAVAAYPPEQPRLEALTTLSYLAGITSRVRLGVGVIVVPQRHPLLLAKQLTTVDVLSKGRLIFGIGVGYVPAELEALGASMRDRGARYLTWPGEGPGTDMVGPDQVFVRLVTSFRTSPDEVDAFAAAMRAVAVPAV